MKIKEFLKRMEAFDELACSDVEFNDSIGFKITGDAILSKFLFKQGRIDMLPFYLQVELGIGYGLRIKPELPWQDWPVYKITKGDASIYLKNLASIVPYQTYTSFSWDSDKFNNFNENRKEKDVLVNLALDIFGGKDSYDNVVTYFLKKGNEIDYHYKVRDENRLKFLLDDDPSDEHQLYRKLISQMEADENIIPTIDSSQLGIYRNRYENLIAAKIVDQRTLQDLKVTEWHIRKLWQSYNNVHGLDPMDDTADHGLSTFSDAKHGMTTLALNLVVLQQESNEYLSKEILDDPIFQSVDSLGDFNSSYTGKEHLFAAAIYDQEMNDPSSAYNHLCTGAFWSAKHLPESIPLIAKQAIALCEENNWNDAATATSWMLNKYNM